MAFGMVNAATDLDVYHNLAGIHTMDLIFIDKRYNYHEPTDSLPNIQNGITDFNSIIEIFEK